MSQFFDSSGEVIPVTYIEAGPCWVIQVKDEGQDGYNAIQLGFGLKKNVSKPLQGHFKKSGKLPLYLQEIRIPEEVKDLKVGDEIRVNQFAVGDKVNVIGVAKAKGFSGAIKRHGFKSHPASHGHPRERRVGSIGSMYPQRVLPGKKMAGRKGPTRITALNLEIIKIDPQKNLLIVKGSVPGVPGGLLVIKERGNG